MKSTLLLALAVVFAASACGDGDGTPDTDVMTDAAADTAAEDAATDTSAGDGALPDTGTGDGATDGAVADAGPVPEDVSLVVYAGFVGYHVPERGGAVLSVVDYEVLEAPVRGTLDGTDRTQLVYAPNAGVTDDTDTALVRFLLADDGGAVVDRIAITIRPHPILGFAGTYDVSDGEPTSACDRFDDLTFDLSVDYDAVETERITGFSVTARTYDRAFCSPDRVVRDAQSFCFALDGMSFSACPRLEYDRSLYGRFLSPRVVTSTITADAIDFEARDDTFRYIFRLDLSTNALEDAIGSAFRIVGVAVKR